MKWSGGGFIAGFLVVHPPHHSSWVNTVAMKIVAGIELGVLFGVVAGVYLFFKRQ
jgi:hypothetical protein